MLKKLEIKITDESTEENIPKFDVDVYEITFSTRVVNKEFNRGGFVSLIEAKAFVAKLKKEYDANLLLSEVHPSKKRQEEMKVRRFLITTQCHRGQESEDPYWHPFQKGQIVHLIGKRNEEHTDRYLLCSDGKERSYLSEYDVKEV